MVTALLCVKPVVCIQQRVVTFITAMLLLSLQDLLSKLTLPGAVLSSIQKSFAPGSLLIARSSANVEDLAGTS
jgi:hypothetical protein